ncbi:glycosyltransferase [Glycomyces terrestris]|uniref:Glycosyltransferase n=1 Tax=Glycomyces terrestris TaxID=2493553 RepID=A0A426UUZ0_9ACTN|nr:glycosyltransferase [Glycomyces terrestris]RRR97687.1 glycosyltransferase [Glycomyces terrestris]
MTGAPLDLTAVAVVPDGGSGAVDCLAALAAQTLGPGRLEVVAATADGDGEDVDRFAEKHPDLVRVVRGPAGGLRAAALAAARGRYVVFVDPGERPAPDRLERLLHAAGDADVLLCGAPAGLAGAAGPAAFTALEAARLFRRELLADVRCPDGGEAGDAELLALGALAEAATVAVCDDDPAPRPDAAPQEWTAAAERLAAAATGLAPEARDALLLGVLTREVAAALDARALESDAFARTAAWRAVADFADAHLTEELRRRLPVALRVRVSLAQRRDLDLLEAAVAETAPGLLAEDGRLYARLPGFRDASGLPDAWYAADGEPLTDMLARGAAPRYLVWTGVRRADYRIEYSCFLPVEGLGPDAVSVGAVVLADGESPAPRAARAEAPAWEVAAEVETGADGGLAVVTARVALGDLLERPPGRWALRASVRLGGFVYDLPLTAPAGYVRREGMLRGVSVEWGPKRSIVVRVRQRATRRGASRLLGFLSDR